MRAAHGTALSRGATGQEITATLDATLAALGASHTERYTSGELAYYELLDIFARHDWASRLRTLFPGAWLMPASG